MKDRLPPEKNRLPRLVQMGVGVLTLLVFAIAICALTLHVRGQIREQIASRDGEVLQSVAFMYYTAEGGQTPALSLDDSAEQLALLLKISRLKGVLAARLYDSAGKFVVSFPPTVRESALTPADIERVTQLKPAYHFEAQAPLNDLFIRLDPSATAPGAIAPLLEVAVPLCTTNNRLAGVSQFIIDGQSIAEEYEQLDNHLVFQAVTVFAVGSFLMVAAQGWAFRRLQQTQTELLNRTASLGRANQELTLVAKTSAIGAVTAHLIHGLRSPLFGLRSLMESRVEDESIHADPALRAAMDTTRRLSAMVGEVAELLRSENDLEEHEVAFPHAIGLVTTRAEPDAAAAGVKLVVASHAEGELSSRDANLVVLILHNLVRNAIQASPHGGTVKLTSVEESGRIVCRVQDEGPGIPAHLLQGLFYVCQSSKADGLGIGLAISKQLAVHLRAELELAKNTPAGCEFALVLAKRPKARRSNRQEA